MRLWSCFADGDGASSDSSARTQKQTIVIAGVVFFVALFARMAHNGYMAQSPLYFSPLGGHVPYLLLARKIFAGDFFPDHRAFNLNSPLYPYLLALQYKLTGGEDFFTARMFTIIADSATCVLVTLLALRKFGTLAAVFAGLFAAVCGPMIFYSAELVNISYTLFALTLAVYIIDGAGGIWRYLASGALLGFAAGTMPSVTPIIALAIPAPYFMRMDRMGAKCGAIALGAVMAIAPITVVNYVYSGHFILLTASGGHNLYIGHNPEAKAGYYVPDNLKGATFSNKGNIFENMKKLAEKIEGRPMEDHEVSPYYTKKALAYIIRHPAREFTLFTQRIAAAVNSFEATTYADYYYQRQISPVLLWAPGMWLIFPLAVAGMFATGKRCYVLYFPVAATLLAIFTFFYISRLRMPMIPFLIVFAGAGAAYIVNVGFAREWKKSALAIIVAAPLCAFSLVDFAQHDTSNEWNKVGIVLRAAGKYPDAENAFLRALRENPANPASYLNLKVLYEKTGHPDKAAEMENAATALLDADGENAFVQSLAKTR